MSLRSLISQNQPSKSEFFFLTKHFLIYQKIKDHIADASLGKNNIQSGKNTWFTSVTSIVRIHCKHRKNGKVKVADKFIEAGASTLPFPRFVSQVYMTCMG